MNSSTEARTACGWSETLLSVMPTGSSPCTRAKVASRFLPSLRMSPPGFIATSMPSASLPMKRMRGAEGSLKPRCTVATSPMRKSRSPTRIGKLRIASTESKRPDTRRRTRSLGVSKKLRHPQPHSALRAPAAPPVAERRGWRAWCSRGRSRFFRPARRAGRSCRRRGRAAVRARCGRRISSASRSRSHRL